ncbi:ADP-ribosylglycohydrolase family protein [Demequina sp. SO4-13]|uniref:ADP-ribosylglycohydrolase family protein n=1 Tax=Demequina sp. SO4-13 TaxID=3401027 RepID=UPI003AF69D90
MISKHEGSDYQTSVEHESLDFGPRDSEAEGLAGGLTASDANTNAPAGFAHNQPSSAHVEDHNEAEPLLTRSLLDHDRVVGLIVASAVGDALGWPQEDRSQIIGGDTARSVRPRPDFRGWHRTAGSQYARYVDPVFPGEYSDDTQLMLAVARACAHDDWATWLTRVELPFWPVYQRGGGRAILSASRAWSEGRPPWELSGATDKSRSQSRGRVARYFASGANGVAMRIGPHAVATAHDPDETHLIRRVITDGIATHGHPRALLGGVIHALALRHALLKNETLDYGELISYLRQDPEWRDPSHFRESLPHAWLEARQATASDSARLEPEQLWNETCAEVDILLDCAQDGLRRGATANDQQVLSEIGVFDKSRSGAGTVTAVAAAYVAARTAPRPIGGLLRTAYLRGADTDTLCSMTGGLLGATHGTGWLRGLLEQVQDVDYLISLAHTLVHIGDGGEPATHYSVAEDLTSAASTRRWQKRLFEGHSVHQSPDGRRVTVERISPLETRTKQFMARAVLRTDDGQTVIVDRTSRTPIPGLGSRREPPGPRVEDRDTRSLPGSDWHPVPHASIAAVELRVPDIESTASFLERFLDMRINSRSVDRIVVDARVILAPTHDSDIAASNAPVVHVHSDDLKETALVVARVDGAATHWSEDGAVLWIREPGGLRLRVTKR